LYFEILDAPLAEWPVARPVHAQPAGFDRSRYLCLRVAWWLMVFLEL
jgi:hypothetical protein